MSDVAAEYGLDGLPVVQLDPNRETVETPIDQVSVDAEAPATFPQEEQVALEQLVQSARWLKELHYTVSQRGVSRDDMRAVLTIRQGIEQYADETTPALEAFNPQAFTDDRSGVNATAALESISATLVNVVKAALRKLIEYIAKLIRWHQEMTKGEDAMQHKLDARVKAINKVRESIAKVTTVLGEPSGLSKTMDEYLLDKLNDPKLAMTRLMIVHMGVPYSSDDKAKLEWALNNTQKGVEGLIKAVDEMVQLIKANKPFPGVLWNPAQHINNVLNAFEQLQEIPPLTDAEKLQFANTRFKSPLRAQLSTVTKYDYILKGYEQANSQLRKINQLGEPGGFQALTDRIEQLTTAVRELSLIATHYYNYNQMKFHLLTAIYQYEGVRYNTLVAGKEYVDDVKRSFIDKVSKELEKHLHSIVR